jgi:dTMP kinase
MFVTFEGGEGTGKSTQIRLLADRYQAMGKTVVVTRWSAEAEALLNYAARDSHLNEIIRPALKAGSTVLCDRFMDSTRAYQGYAGACTFHLLEELEKSIVGETRPNLTLVFDIDPVVGLARAKSRGGGAEDRFERKGLAFHQRLREGFLEIAKADPARCRVIDASPSVEVVSAMVWRAIHG